jgi:large subunit ribosomal protein L17
VHGKIITTVVSAKEIKRHVEKLITKAKKNTLASRRRAETFLRPIKMADGKTTAGQHLFNKLGPKYKDRQGGYTRIIKLGKRSGDSSEMALLELV